MITPLPGATRAQARLAPPSRSSACSRSWSMPRARSWKAPARAICCLIEVSWPGQMRTVYGDHQRFVDTYFKTYPGMYFTGDGARRDEDGYYWITGRVDDVINVSGHRIGTAEVESALVGNTKVAEAAVVGYPHDIKGQGIYAYVTLKAGEDPTDDLRKELVAWVRKEIGPIATPDVIQWAPGLPKTRSGKIMRRILRKIAENDVSQPRRHFDPCRSRRGRRPGEEPRKMNPTIQQLSADLAAGRTTSRKLTEEALTRIEDPKGEGKRAFIKVWRSQALAAADASDLQRKAGLVASPLAGHPGLDQEPLRRGGRDHAFGIEGARRCAAGQGRCARRGAPARGRRRHRRQHQHERVRLHRRRRQPALRHAGQSRGPHARAGRLVVGRRRLGRRPHGRRGTRHRHRRLGAYSSGALRHHGFQAHGTARADRRRHPALDLARLDRPARQLGRMLRHRRRGFCGRVHRDPRCRASRRPALRRPEALCVRRRRRHGRQGLRARLQGARRQGREDRAYRPAATHRTADDQRPRHASPPPKPMPGTRI